MATMVYLKKKKIVRRATSKNGLPAILEYTKDQYFSLQVKQTLLQRMFNTPSPFRRVS